MSYEGFSPAVRAWFDTTFGTPTPAQAEAWPAIADGDHSLVLAPTGSGKTFSFRTAVCAAVLDPTCEILIHDFKGDGDWDEIGDGVAHTFCAGPTLDNVSALVDTLNRLGDDARIWFRVRGDTSFRPLGHDEYEELRKEYAASEKLDLLDR